MTTKLDINRLHSQIRDHVAREMVLEAQLQIARSLPVQNETALRADNDSLRAVNADLREALQRVADQYHADIDNADEACRILDADTDRCKQQIADLIANPIKPRNDLGEIGVFMTTTEDLVDGAIGRIVSNTRRATDIRTAEIARAAIAKATQ